VLTEAQLNVLGPLHPAGIDDSPEVTERLVIFWVSLELNPKLTVWLPPPTTALTDTAGVMATVLAAPLESSWSVHADKQAKIKMPMKALLERATGQNCIGEFPTLNGCYSAQCWIAARTHGS
jgi:hypothetical protein